MVIFGITTYNSQFREEETIQEPYQEKTPDQFENLNVCVTSTRYYYIVKSHYSEDENYIYLDDYFLFNQHEWERQDSPLQIELSKCRLIER